MTTPNHTPTPMPPPYTADGRSIRAEGGRKLVTIARIVPGVLAKEHEAPTAAFIVRAVNAHEAMIEALAGLLENIPQPKDVRKDFSLMVYMEAARKALRAAKGE